MLQHPEEMLIFIMRDFLLFPLVCCFQYLKIRCLSFFREEIVDVLLKPAHFQAVSTFQNSVRVPQVTKGRNYDGEEFKDFQVKALQRPKEMEKRERGIDCNSIKP
jgi:hypothetical protein